MTHDHSPERDADDLSTLGEQTTLASDVVPSARVPLPVGATLADGRLTVERPLGSGGMGMVYQAFDAQRRCSVALKTLSNVDPSGVYNFKNEFRLLAGIHHPNLVELYELFAEADVWFFTMELVPGCTFERWVRPAGALDEARLRDALRQLVCAVAALHAAGKLHRDLKPSNVLVTDTGRVVVLDFGLVIDPELGAVGHTVQTFDILGTPAYMSPEQAAGSPATSASDLYMLGVMLFVALVGRLPFTGNALQQLAAKQQQAAPRPDTLVPDLPGDLVRLCNELLEPEPRKRPTLTELETRLGVEAETLRASDPGLPVAILVDRVAELQQLEDAFASTLGGDTVIVAVTGESGIGKTTLCDHFLRNVRRDRSALVLAGRCREQETVPFKALDAVVDELSRYMRTLPDEKAAALLPRDAFALRRLFPVLGRVGVIADVPPPAVSNIQELRRRGFIALGELLARVRDRQPLVVCLDDLQWTDVDSVALLRHLLIDRNPVPMLVIIAYRSDYSQDRLLEQVLNAAQSNSDLRLQRLSLGPLSTADAEHLATRLLRAEGEVDPALGAAIARESGGSPFFATELVRSARSGVSTSRAAPSLSSTLLARIAKLPPGARAMLELLAVIGHPLRLDVLRETVQSDSSELDALRRAQLIRSHEHEGIRVVECYHDRIRESVSESLSEPEKAAHYAALAKVLVARDEAQPELLSVCLLYAGDRERAAQQLMTAADQASAILAFDRAASLYERALALLSHDSAQRCALHVKLGTSLENAGRGKAAADAYVQAAELSSGEAASELRRRAAEQLLVTGHLDEGLTQLRSVCAQVGVAMPAGKRRALAAYAWNNLQLRFRPLELPARGAAADERERLQLRVASTLVTGLIGYVPLQAASSAGRYLLLALNHGNSIDVIRGLGFQAYFQTLVEPSSRHAASLLSRMDELAEENGSREATGFASLINGTSAYHCGRFSVAREHLANTVRTLRGCSGVDWEIDSAHVYDQLIASDTGGYAHIAQTTPALIDEAWRRGRVWTAAMLSGFGVQAWLVPDKPEGYSSVLAEAKRLWRGGAQALWPDFVLLAGESQQLIYQGDALQAFELFELAYERYASSELMRSAGAGIGGFAAHHGKAAAAALNCGRATAAQAARMRAVVQRCVTSLRRAGGAKRAGIAGMLEAALALDRGATSQAQAHLVSTADVLESAGAMMWAAAARRRAGQLTAGAESSTLIALGDAFMHSQDVQNLEAMTEVSCPGCRARAA